MVPAAAVLLAGTMNEAWRRADFVASNSWLDQAGTMTFNAARRTNQETQERSERNRSSGFGGQYISGYSVR
ncbi:MAG: hypothetical protein V2I27_05910 [Erythrobacter sp.]|jgi:hypothetical protein|nr:hypothetical protein [Erythrobacter sp.]